MERKLKDYAVISLKGIAMGAADVVPGVSGGTIALIAGIYKELIDTFTKINFGLIKIIRKEGFVKAFYSVNGPFLVALLSGIIFSILSLAKLFHFLLETEPVSVWSFFFGLIIASVWLVGKRVSIWNLSNIVALIVGAVLSYGITILSPASGPDTLLFLFISGMLAFVAMILPGISGSFILLLLGAYQLVLGKVSSLIDSVRHFEMDLLLSNLVSLGVFALGGVIGLLSFSRVLKWMFEKHEARTLALLSGFLIGSLNKVWPWKQTTEVFIKHQGEVNESVVALVQNNVLPNDSYRVISDADALLGMTVKDPQLGLAIVFGIAGFLIIFLLERFSAKYTAE
jgi:putative membrane protein